MAGDRTRTMTMSLVVEDKPARESLGRIDKSTKQTADTFGKAGKAIKLAMTTVALGAVVKFGSDLANRAGMMEGIMRRVSQVFGDNAGDIAKWAEESSSAFGESTTTLQGMAAEIGDLLIPMGLSRDVAAEMSIETLNAANALSEWTGGKVTVEEAAGAMTKAFLGEREELKKLGISINEADVKTALLAKGQLKLEGDALKAAKAIATQELIFSKSADALTAYAEGGDSVIRSQKDLKAAVDNAVDALALKMIPVFEAGFAAAKDFGEGAKIIVDWLNALPDPVKKAVLAISGLIAVLKLLAANKIIAGLALVTGAIIKMGDASRNQKQAVDDMKTALEEAGGSAEDAAVAFLKARDGSNELLIIAALLGLTLGDVAKAASGDEDAMHRLENALDEAKKEGRLTFEQMGLLASEMKNVAEATPKAIRELELLAEAERLAARESTNLGADLIILGSDMGEVVDDVEELTDSISDLAKEQRKAVDPLFALGDAQDKYLEALAKTQGLVHEGKRGTKEFTDATEELVKARGDLNFREKEFAEVSVVSVVALRNLGIEAGLTTAQIDNLITVNITLGDDLTILGAGMREVTDDVEDLTDSISDLADEERKAVDPLFALGDAQDKYSEALEKTQELVKKGKEGTKEFTDVTEELVKARGDLNFREAEFAEVAVVSIEALRNMGIEAGLTTEQIDNLIAANVTLNNTPVLSLTQAASSYLQAFGLDDFAHGGVVPGPVGAPVPALLHGGEVVLNQRQQSNLGGGGGGATVNVFVEGSMMAVDDLVVAVRDGLVELERVNGSTGL